MFPIAVVAGVIGAVVSGAQGASWLSDHIGSSKGTASVGGKSEAKPATDAKASSFETTLSAQLAGQTVPTTQAASPSATPLPQSGPDYDAAARIKAGVVAYSHVGEHRGGHARQHPAAGDDRIYQASA